MKSKLGLFNAALVLYFAGLLCAIGVSYGIGAFIILAGSAIILGLYFFQLFKLYQGKGLLTVSTLLYSLGILALGEIFLQGFSTSMGMGILRGSFYYHVIAGFILVGLFGWYSINSIRSFGKMTGSIVLIVALVVTIIMSIVGLLGFAGLLPGTARYIYYGFVFLMFFYLLYFLILNFRSDQQHEFTNRSSLIVLSLMVISWILRWQFPHLVSPGIFRILVFFGFTLILILPLSVVLFNRFHFVTAFILYAIIVDFYFISFDRDFKYLVNVGLNECVGYQNATEHPVIDDPGISMEELFKPPTDDELADIVNSWESKDFSPRQVRVEHTERRANGDSIKVISHDVNGKKHYGLIRIPAGIDIVRAPILLGLHGGGADPDVLKSEYFDKRAPQTVCEEVLDKYISIAPSFRGDIARGDDFCFRSEGYTGDVWLGAAEDAIAFLEVVKGMYSKDDGTKVLAMGVSRGATVGLIIGALTEKVDYIISVSTHTNFHNVDVFRGERVGTDYPRVFFTPRNTPEDIRKKLIASSAYYFVDRLPPFEVHQGSADVLTTVKHAKMLEQRLAETGRSDSTFRIHYYEGQGHGASDETLLCKSLIDFIAR